jgi:hypothetical protein
MCSQLPDNDNTSVTNMAEYLAAEVIEGYRLPTPLVWVEHYPEHEGEIGEYLLGYVRDLGTRGGLQSAGTAANRPVVVVREVVNIGADSAIVHTAVRELFGTYLALSAELGLSQELPT